MSEVPFAAYICAELRLAPTREGGRKSPIRSGYRSNCWIGNTDEEGERTYNDAVVYLESGCCLNPGECALVRLQPAFPDLWEQVDVGSVVEVCEGHRVVGEATVTALFPPP